jgi:predicted Zn-dependent protease
MSWLIAVVALVSTSVPPAQAATASGFAHLREQDLRVARIAYRLSIAGKALCRQIQRGFVLPSAGPTDLACPVNVAVMPDGVVNAWADGERVMITSAMVDQCRSDDELALVIGHEMSHNILQHRRRLAAAGVEMGLLPVSKAGSAAMRRTEEEADRLAVRMAGAAGYDLAQVVPFVRRLLATTGLSEHAATTHPASLRRLALLDAAVARAADDPDRR